MNSVRIYLLVLIVFFSYAAYSISIKSQSNVLHFEQDVELTEIKYVKKYNEKNFPYFNFRVDNQTVYHKLTEFNSSQARALFILAKNDQFNSDSLAQTVDFLYSQQASKAKLDDDLFKRKVRNLEKRAEELKKNATQKAKQAKFLEQTFGGVEPVYVASRNIDEPNEEVLNVKKEPEVIKRQVETVVQDKVEIKPLSNLSSKENESRTSEYKYCYQVGCFDKRPASDFYKGMGFVKEEIVDDGQMFRYLTGSYQTYAEASRAKAQVSSIFPAAFMVAYKNGVRVNLKDAIAVTDKSQVVKESSSVDSKLTKTSKEINYRVQVGVFTNEVPNEVNVLMDKYKFLGTSMLNQLDGRIVCTIGHFNSADEAGALKKELAEQGFVDVFTVAYAGDKRISKEEAIRLLGK